MPEGDVFAALVVGLVFVFVMAFLWLVNRYQTRDRELVHAERMAALEKGIPLPPQLLPSHEMQASPPSPRQTALQVTLKRLPGNSLKTGVVTLCIGLGVILAFLVTEPGSGRWPWGLVLALAGLGYLIHWAAGGRDEWRRGMAFEEEARRRLLASEPERNDSAGATHA